jgi:hypothetical protein
VEIGINNDDIPTPTIEAIMSGYETNDVFIDGSYAYVATNDISKDVVIIDLTTNQEVGYFNDTSWFGTAQGVFVAGNVGYVTIGLNLHTFDLSSKSGSRPERDRVFLWGTGYRLFVVGNYAYIAVDWGSSELRLVNVANASDIRLAAKADVNGERGQEVFVNDTGTRAYLATSQSSSKRELFIINTNVPTNSKNNSSYNLPILSTYDSEGMSPRGVTAVTGNKVILVGTGAEEYQVIDITNETNPQRCGGINVDTGIYGVASILETDNDAFSYVVTGDTTKEFKIIEGGPGGSYASEGVFTSQFIDNGQPTAFNRFEATVSRVAENDITMQVAVADPVSGSCVNANYSFIGPDMTSNTFFTESAGKIIGTIPFGTFGNYKNPARGFKYRVFLSTTESTLTPTFYDILLNYSP